jgi:hypothetical protein
MLYYDIVPLIQELNHADKLRLMQLLMNQILLEEGLECSKVDTEYWLHQPHVQMSLDRAIAWAEANPPQETDLEQLAVRINTP